MKNLIGLDKAKSDLVIESLNKLLSSYQVYYQNLRGFHWNVVGSDFYTLHEKFEELYDSAKVSIDEVAERIKMLEGNPFDTYTAYVKNSSIPEESGVKDPKSCVSKTISNLQALLDEERKVVVLAEDSGDEVTVDLMVGFMEYQEKTIWMLASYNK